MYWIFNCSLRQFGKSNFLYLIHTYRFSMLCYIWWNFTSVHFVLFSRYIPDRGEWCHGFHVVYLEINVKCCWNVIKFNITYLTCTYEWSKKNVFLNGIGPHLFMKKMRISCIWNNLLSIIEHETWIDVGWKHHT